MKNIVEPFRKFSVNVILTFENRHVPKKVRDYFSRIQGTQQIYDLDISVLKPKFRKSWEVRNNWKINEKYSPEKHVLEQVINDLSPEVLKPYLLKISLSYSFPENISDEFDFIYRTSSKYYFQPDQRDMFEDDIVETFGVSEKVRPHSETPNPNVTEEDYLKVIQSHREETELYFKNL